MRCLFSWMETQDNIAREELRLDFHLSTATWESGTG